MLVSDGRSRHTSAHLEFRGDGPWQTVGASRRGDRHCRTSACFLWPGKLSTWAASGRHSLSRQEYYFLFSADDFDSRQSGALGLDALD